MWSMMHEDFEASMLLYKVRFDGWASELMGWVWGTDGESSDKGADLVIGATAFWKVVSLIVRTGLKLNFVACGLSLW